MRFVFCGCFMVYVIHLIGVCGFPVNNNVHRSLPSPELFSFMKKYGYIEENSEVASQYTEDGLSNVIKNIQKYGAIPQTGIIDNATLGLLSRRRCGVPDIIKTKRSKRFVAVRSGGWKKREITFFIANWSPRLDRDTVKKNIILALDTWGRYGRLRFREVFDPSADIIVAFGTGYHGDKFPFDGPGGVLAHAFFPYEFGNFGGDIHFDDEEKWVDKVNPDGEGTHFYTVALHELGHSLGLAHSSIPRSIMFPYYQQSDGNSFALDYDDILGMYELYIKSNIPDDVPTTSDDRSSENEDRTREDEERDDDYIDGNRSEGEDAEEVPEYPEKTTQRYDYPTQPTIDNHTVVYHGDVETVDDHITHDDKFHLPTTNSPSLPDICQGHFDAVATLRGELFFFKEQYIWRLRERLYIEHGYPIQIWHMFPKLPRSIKRIDAAYERPDGMIVLFTGRQYWVYDGNDFIENSPQPITTYGLPRWVKRVDAVQNWAKNRKTYFYYKNEFWRYNETSKTMDPDYPKNIERWRGVPENLDAATTWKDGKTYFFKGKLYWKFDNDWVIVSDASPLPAAQMWLGCPKELDENDTSMDKYVYHHDSHN